MKKSPSGSLCPYYYLGGELHPLKYGGFGNKEDLFAIMRAEENFILKSFGQNNRRIWVDLYETHLDDEVINALVMHIQAIRSKIDKLCIVGCSFRDRYKIIQNFKVANLDIVKYIRFFSDPEEAKQWLVGKLN